MNSGRRIVLSPAWLLSLTCCLYIEPASLLSYIIFPSCVLMVSPPVRILMFSNCNAINSLFLQPVAIVIRSSMNKSCSSDSHVQARYIRKPLGEDLVHHIGGQQKRSLIRSSLLSNMKVFPYRFLPVNASSTI